MAEIVQYHLEQMVDELEDFGKQGLFTPPEIKTIIRKRTKFEYTLRRRRVTRSNFLKYIEYEMNVDKLRQQRQKRLLKATGNYEKASSDYSIARRIQGLFERALSRHSGDVDLWVQYMEFVRQNDFSEDREYSSQSLSRLYARAISAHPYEARLWVAAAAHELEVGGNQNAARRLLQRSLRVNPKEEELWLEYFRLELLLAQRIRERRRVLGIDKKQGEEEEEETEGDELIKLKDEEEEGGFGDIEQRLEEQAMADTIDGSVELDQNQRDSMATDANEYLQGAVPRLVYQQAIQQIKDSLELRMEFASVALRFPDMRDKVYQAILDSIAQDFSSDPKAQAYLCQVHMADVDTGSAELVDALRTAVEKYQKALMELDTGGMWAEYVRFLTKWQQAAGTVEMEQSLGAYFGLLMERAKAAIQKDLPGRLSEEAALVLVDMMDDKGEWLAMLTEQFPNSGILWCRRMQQMVEDNNNNSQTERVFEGEALASCPQSKDLWAIYCDWVESSSSNVYDKYMAGLARLTTQIATAAERLPLQSYLQVRYTRWSFKTMDADEWRNAYSKMIRNAPLATSALFACCLELEPDTREQTRLHELACQVDPLDSDPWLRYLESLVRHKKLPEAASVYWRASQHITDEAFATQYQELLKKF